MASEDADEETVVADDDDDDGTGMRRAEDEAGDSEEVDAREAVDEDGARAGGGS